MFYNQPDQPEANLKMLQRFFEKVSYDRKTFATFNADSPTDSTPNTSTKSSSAARVVWMSRASR